MFRLGTSFGNFRLVCFAWELMFEFVRFATFDGELLLGIIRLGTFVW